MKISGLQKMTLLDYPGQVACTVFLGGCNFRCPFCHNGELLEGNVQPVMDQEAFLSFLSKRKGLLDAVCVSGGEPTLQAGLPALLEQIKQMGYLIKLDTNGSRPDVLKKLVSSGLLDYVAMDIKNAPDLYEKTAGANVPMEKIEESICFLLEDHVDYELRTTVESQLHNLDSVARMGAWVESLGQGKKAKRWFVQPFVDRDTVLFTGLSRPNDVQLSEFVSCLSQFSLHSSLRG